MPYKPGLFYKNLIPHIPKGINFAEKFIFHLKNHFMQFFIDTANLDQIREANALGILDGVTTNHPLTDLGMAKFIADTKKMDL